MFGFSPKLRIREEDRLWVNQGFHRLEKLPERRRMLEAKVIEPTAEDFPDPYDNSSEAVEMLFSRLCIYTAVDRNTVQLEILPDEIDELRDFLPVWSSDRGTQAAGLYLPAHKREQSDQNEHRMVVAPRSTLMRDQSRRLNSGT